MSDGLVAELRRRGLEAGLAGVGVCSAEPFEDVRQDLEDAVSEGRSGLLGFTFRDPERATDVRLTFPWARRLVVGVFGYLPEGGDPGPPRPGTGRVARFAVDDQYPGLRRGLWAVASVLESRGHRAEILVNDNRLVDRAAAVRAGVAWWGKSTMVLAPSYGPYLLVGSVVTDAELETDEPMRRSCGSCRACMPACPTGAIIEPGVLDASRCLAHWAQVPGTIPLQFREPMGDRVYGCDECLDACPPGKRILEKARSAERGRVDLLELLSRSDRELLRRFGHFYIPRRQPRYLRRNALVALGNAGGPGAELVLAGYLGHPDSLLRGHAAWALGRRGGWVGRAALIEAGEREADAEVGHEIRRALRMAERTEEPASPSGSLR